MSTAACDTAHARADNMPRHPQLAAGTPVVWRRPDVLQIGFTLAIPESPRNARAALGLLDGTRSVAQAAAQARVDPGWLQRCVRQLGSSGLLGRTGRGRVAVLGDGVLGERLVEALAERYTVSRDPFATADVAVVTRGWAASERAMAGALTERGTPHLLVGTLSDGAAVGPFVVPGEQPCQRCLDLTMAERDACWPQLAAQLERASESIDPAAALWAVGLAAAHVAAFLAGRDPESLARTWELIHGELRVRRWPHRPDCACARAVA